MPESPSPVSLTRLAHRLLGEVLVQGDTAIDATVGNGHDTLFLARCVGNQGQVYGFDIQQAALNAANERLQQAGFANRVRLFPAGHESMLAMISSDWHGRIRAIMFNLGYLPRSDKTITTCASSTLQALAAATRLIATGGRISIVAYRGHAGGNEEWSAVRDWANALDPLYFRAQFFYGSDQLHSPVLVMIDCLEKIDGLAAF